MAKSGSELLLSARERIKEVDPSEVAELLEGQAVIVDCRETEELSAGLIPDAIHIPRSYLETRIEGLVPDRSQRVILYCSYSIKT